MRSMETDVFPLLLDFSAITSVPGNVVDGVGKRQNTCAVGATGPDNGARIVADVHERR